MARSIADSKNTKAKKKPGRPRTTGTGQLLAARWHVADLDAIDAYAKAVGVDRAEAVRSLVRLGLTMTAKKKRAKPTQLE